ncbi:MAG: haloalkane dehalogenase [Bacteroidota bacterium]|nr:haloalkane dehalogenase [Bacteroidota bacterium]
MKRYRIIIVMAITFINSFGLLAQKPETNISAEFPFATKIQVVNGTSIFYYEQGQGDPILFLHGIPSSSYLWRNIIPLVSTQGRAIAFDLAGYGKSGIPPNNDYSILSQYSYVKGFIDSLQLKNITLVVNDLGSLLGLKYAIENPSNIKRIVFIEAAFMPTELWYKQLTLVQKIMFKMMRNPKRAEKLIVTKNKIPPMMMKMAIKRKLSDVEMKRYLEPFENSIERRKVMLYGPGPATFPKKGISQVKGDFADEINKIAIGLKYINETKPFLLFYASPGMITRKPAVEYAKQNFKNLTLISVGKGKHFLQEDHPNAIADGIVNWMKNNNN